MIVAALALSLTIFALPSISAMEIYSPKVLYQASLQVFCIVEINLIHAK